MARGPADDWFEQANPWGGALADLRALLRSCGRTRRPPGCDGSHRR